MPMRPRRYAAEWAELVGQYFAGTESEEIFCQRHDLSRATFRKWKYRYTAERSTPVAGAPLHAPASSLSSFVELKAASGPSRGELIRIQVDQRITIDCPLASNLRPVAELIQALRDGR